MCLMKIIIFFENLIFSFLPHEEQKKFVQCKKCKNLIREKHIFRYTYHEGKNLVAVCPVCFNDTFTSFLNEMKEYGKK